MGPLLFLPVLVVWLLHPLPVLAGGLLLLLLQAPVLILALLLRRCSENLPATGPF